MSIIPVEHPIFEKRLPGDLVRGVIESLCGITEIDTEWPYRIMCGADGDTTEDLKGKTESPVYPIEWVDESLRGSIPRVKVRSAKTGEEFLVPSMLLEKLSPLEALGEQAE